MTTVTGDSFLGQSTGIRRFPSGAGGGGALASQVLSESPDEGAVSGGSVSVDPEYGLDKDGGRRERRAGQGQSFGSGQSRGLGPDEANTAGHVIEEEQEEGTSAGVGGSVERRLGQIEERQKRIEELLVRLSDSLQQRK